MYSVEQLRRAVSHPAVFLREANRLYHKRLYQREYNTAGVDIFEEDWDTLLILDGCRRDTFESTVEIPGKYQTRKSRGSTTVEFLRGNVADRELWDTVYVTANPQFYRHQKSLKGKFYETINIWRDSGWDETYGTVLPETVTQKAIEAHEEHPNKRILVHYIQPHYPFLTEETSFDKGFIEERGGGSGDFWTRMFTGELQINTERIEALYRENLEIVLSHVEQLLEAIEGRTVVTSDHGNMMGERASPIPIREWGHPNGLYTDELISVPWLIIEEGARREIISSENRRDSDRIEDEVVSDRLESLGYVE